MAEYVDRQAVIDALEKGWNGMVVDVFNLIRELPSADVVEVVRCKDCVNAQTIEGVSEWGFCSSWGRWTKGDGYCQSGEEKWTQLTDKK